MIYVASPYSHPDAAVREQRYRDVMSFVAERTRMGEFLYSPILHWHPLAVAHGKPTSADFWHEHNFEMLCSLRELYVLKLEGWETSIGVAEEVQLAERNSMPIEYWSPL